MSTPPKQLPSLCGCFDDCCTCCAVWCCHCVTAPQLYESVVSKGKCLPYFILLLVIIIFYEVTSALHGVVNDDVFGVMNYLAGIGGLISCIVSTCIVYQIRTIVRAKNNIPAGQCGGCEDCCCAFWCNSCTQCQILRFLGLTNGKYSLVSPTGVPAGMPPPVKDGVVISSAA